MRCVLRQKRDRAAVPGLRASFALGMTSKAGKYASAIPEYASAKPCVGESVAGVFPDCLLKVMQLHVLGFVDNTHPAAELLDDAVV